MIGRFFDGEQTSEIALRASTGKDLWVAMQPDQDGLRAPIEEGNRRFATAPPLAQAVVIARWPSAGGGRPVR